MTHYRLFERAHPGPGAPLTLTGELPGYTPSAAYEGRLQIGNAVGDCTAELVAGDLPPGHTISVDNATQEVVVRWPAYQAGGTSTVPIPNASASDGNLSGWEAGAGWSHSPAGGDGHRFMYANHGGESDLVSTLRYPVAPGQSVTASVQVDQGASSKGNAGARVLLLFRPAAGANVVALGNLVDSASNSATYPSTVTYAMPSAGTLSIGARGVRRRQNKAVWIDAFTWNVTITAAGVGVNTDVQYEITIRVRDSAGRTADWTGVLGEYYVYITSQMYPVVIDEQPMNFGMRLVGFDHKNPFVTESIDEPMGFGMQLVGFDHARSDQTVIEPAGFGMQLVGFSHVNQSQTLDEPAGFGMQLVGFKHENLSQTVTENAGFGMQLTGFEHV